MIPWCLRLLPLVALAAAGGCRDKAAREPAGSGRIAEVAGSLEPDTINDAGQPQSLAVQSSASAVQSLSHAAGGADGTRYAVQRAGNDAIAGGVVVGRVGGGKRASQDSIVTPTVDTDVCAPFTQRAVPSEADGVGNAVVWLVGVASGPPDTTSRRSALRLDGCRLEPRVQRVPMGGTLMVTSRDAMTTRLRFTDLGANRALRATVMLNDAGQVVPTSEASVRPALLEVRDDLHPWVRAWIAVAPHPFVAVTSGDGQFRFEGVPPGRYSLVVWSEALGTRARDLRVTSGVETRLDVRY